MQHLPSSSKDILIYCCTDGCCCVLNVNFTTSTPFVSGRYAGRDIRPTVSTCSFVSPSSPSTARMSSNKTCQPMTCCCISVVCLCTWVAMSFYARFSLRHFLCPRNVHMTLVVVTSIILVNSHNWSFSAIMLDPLTEIWLSRSFSLWLFHLSLVSELQTSKPHTSHCTLKFTIFIKGLRPIHQRWRDKWVS